MVSTHLFVERKSDLPGDIGGWLFFFKKNSNFYPGGHPFGQTGWLSTTQVLKGSLLPESSKNEKEKKRESIELRSRGSTS